MASVCILCACHMHDVCLPSMCLVCAWCVPGVCMACPGTVFSNPPHPPHTHAMPTQPHMPPPHAGAVGLSPLWRRAQAPYAACGTPTAASAAATPTAAAAAATHHMCRRHAHGRGRAHCCRTSRHAGPPLPLLPVLLAAAAAAAALLPLQMLTYKVG